MVQASKGISTLYKDDQDDIYTQKQFPQVAKIGDFCIPIEDENKSVLKDFKINSGSKPAVEKDQIKILGFTSKENLPNVLLNEPTLFYGSSKCQIFSSLFNSCVNKEKIIVCAYSNRGQPNLGFLSPVGNKNCFQLIPIPLQNEVQDVGAPEMINPPTDLNKGTAKAYIESIKKFNNINELPDPLQSCWAKSYTKLVESQGKTPKWEVTECPFITPQKSSCESFGLIASHGLDKISQMTY